MIQLTLFPDKRLELWALVFIAAFIGVMTGFFLQGAIGNTIVEKHIVVTDSCLTPAKTKKQRKEYKAMSRREYRYERSLRGRGG